MLFLFLFSFFGRQWLDSMLARLDQQKTVHLDQSHADSGVKQQVRPSIRLMLRNENGELTEHLLDAEKYQQFVRDTIPNLTQARKQVQAASRQRLHDDLFRLFTPISQRTERFANWYFAYDTTYRLLWEGLRSASQHALSTEAQSLQDAVAYDVEAYLQQHYEEIVLRPEITHVYLKQVYQDNLQQAHHDYLLALSKLHDNFQQFVAHQTTHAQALDVSKVAFTLDWDSQFNKISMADYERGTPDAIRGIGLAAAGGATGKAVGGVAGKAMASVVGKGLFAKAAAPIASKAALLAVQGTAGAAAGSIVPGAGTALGGTIGLGTGIAVDYAISKGIEQVQREEFISDIQEALKVTRWEWENTMQASLRQGINIWFEDTLQLLPLYTLDD
ncbi:hypothetical protein QUF61_12490 [Candidatus Venteria ishoeyi]|uniref:hypothetical protein n=1 Tax=Candidatus Venteria ishoeyi TaxID=1899563 RepID=UPI0025A5307A|nr:hypothetical protein [Candidatus Venteria ishoeyi]MDM8547307.1 hypothetical protein [Candidatus Venteria ishoeyi]